MTVTSEFNTLKDFLIDIMTRFPETRDSDTQLYIRSCRELGAKSLDDIERINLSIVSLHKTRQLITNKLGLCKPSEQVTEGRSKRNFDIREYMGKVKATS
ncbi:hypothetical protein P9E34_14225 [Schinkia azotoformans]|uniref:hypothetical protein n=1 Tax=Schinkia azotoformans TaxID=1454 RepID=UPI002DBB4FE9|nr:hypothetical protein [Schinkia azotoformans]MEC1725871.1 hypothetical protein [Schinkia azotoformans]